jgi:multidrug efflux pump subunit AcrA (membrane-fusion protein)
VVRSGIAIVALFFCGFVGWAAIAPLDSAIISPGKVIAQSPRGLIAARVRAEDIADVRPGATVKVDLSAYKARRLPMLTGVVSQISPDTIEDTRTGQPYFAVRIDLDRASLKDTPEARLIPGMPVQVEIPTGSHTALEYLIEPIHDVMRNGMREK